MGNRVDREKHRGKGKELPPTIIMRTLEVRLRDDDGRLVKKEKIGTMQNQRGEISFFGSDETLEGVLESVCSSCDNGMLAITARYERKSGESVRTKCQPRRILPDGTRPCNLASQSKRRRR